MIGDRIKYERRKMGLTQGELAEKVGISRCAINKIENNKTKEIKYSTAHGIADALGIPADFLFCLE